MTTWAKLYVTPEGYKHKKRIAEYVMGEMELWGDKSEGTAQVYRMAAEFAVNKVEETLALAAAFTLVAQYSMGRH